MIVNTVPQLIEMSEGVVPEGFRGLLSRVQKHFPTQHGSLQKGTLSSGGQSIQIVFSGRDPVPANLNGREIYCMAVKGNKGLYGLKRKDDDFKNKVTPQIWVYSDADVAAADDDSGQSSGGSEGNSAPPPRQQGPAKEPPRQQAPSGQNNSRANGHANGNRVRALDSNSTDKEIATNIHYLKKRLMQRANLYLMCFKAADYVRERITSEQGPEVFSESQHQACVASLYIQMTGNRRDGFEDFAPLKEVEIKKG